MKGKAYSFAGQVVNVMLFLMRMTLNRICPSFTDELRAKEKLNREPKYSFEELSDEEDNSGKLYSLICISSVMLLVEHL